MTILSRKLCRAGALLKALPWAAVFLVGAPAFAADALRDLFSPTPTPFQRELKPVYERLQTKLQSGSHDRSLFTNELNAIDQILKRYPQERPEKLAEVRYNLAIGHWKLFGEPKLAIQLLQELKRDFPETSYAKKVATDIEAIPKIDAGIALRKTMTPGMVFPDFEVRDMAGKVLSVASCRGQPVLLLSWSVSAAPWLEFTKLSALQRKYEPDTFAVIGLNMDEDETLVRAYLKTNNVPGRQYFDGRGLRNELALKYCIGLARYAFVLDRQGHIVAIDPEYLDDVEKAIGKALKKK